MKKELTKEIVAWRVSAPKGFDRSCVFDDDFFAFEAVKPGEPLLLLNESGDSAWGRGVYFLSGAKVAAVLFISIERLILIAKLK